MEEEVPLTLYDSLSMKPPISVSPAGLSPVDAMTIANALITSLHPLIITSHTGRNLDAISSLVTLSTLLAIPIFSTCSSTVNVPFSHPYLLGITYMGPGPTTASFQEHLRAADTILILDSDIPWIPSSCEPKTDGSARVFIIDGGDPLRTISAMGTWDAALHCGVELVCRADNETAIAQVLELIKESVRGNTDKIEAVSRDIQERIEERAQRLNQAHTQWVERLDADELAAGVIAKEGNFGFVTVPQIMRALREITAPISAKSLIIDEATSNLGLVWEHARSELPGSFLTSGGSSLGYALGACVGAILGDRVGNASNGNKYDLVTAVVGDGAFMFGIPSSAFWIARRYETVS